jgi:uracil-DNA glycosylase
MPNWKTPRALGSALEVDRRKRPNQLYATQVAELNKFVVRIKSSERDESVPWFDPSGAGVNARVLFLLQDPSNAAEKTGFISPDNPDKTADNTTYFRNNANLRQSELIHWNIVPWAIKDRKVESEVDKANPFLKEFIQLLPKLVVVVCMGIHATNGWDSIYPNNPSTPGWHSCGTQNLPSLVVLSCPHPSAQSIDGYHPLVDGLNPTQRIEMTLRNVRNILDSSTPK